MNSLSRWIFGRPTELANSAHPYVYWAAESSGQGKNLLRDMTMLNEPDGNHIIQAKICDNPSFTTLHEGATVTLKGSKLAVTVITDRNVLLCHKYPVPDGRTIIVGQKGIELAKEGEQWIGESGRICKKYGQPVSASGINKQEGLNDPITGDQKREDTQDNGKCSGNIRGMDDSETTQFSPKI